MSSKLLHRKILVTGASGFIGSHLCRRLCEDGAEVYAISRTKHSKNENGLCWYLGDLAEMTVVRDLLTTVQPDVIFHLAGYPVGARELSHIMPSFRSNLLSTVNILIVASEVGCGRIVLTGSMEEPGREDPHSIPCSPYAASKWASSAYAQMFHALYKLPLVILRVFMVYGPAQKDIRKLIPYVILSLLREESPRLTNGQRQVDWIHVEDVVEGFVTAAQAHNIEGCTIDIGSGMLVPVRTVVEHLVHVINPKIKPHFGALEDRQLEQIRMADIEKSNVLMGWKPRISMEEGLKQTVEWYRKQLKNL